MINVVNPARFGEIIFHPYEPLTQEEIRSLELLKKKTRRKRRKGRILLTLIVIFLIVPVITSLSALSGFLHDESISMLWGIICGLIGLILYFSIKDNYFDYL